jgi:hypothetical protein
MEQSFIKYINEFFKKLIDINSFSIKMESSEEQSYMIEYCSKDFVIKIEKYFREFYVSLYKIDKPDDEINLFNLLGYLKQFDAEAPKSEYFRKEKDLEECYKKQLNHISSVIYENYTLISDFFCDDNHEAKFAEFKKYWKTKHPELFKVG